MDIYKIAEITDGSILCNFGQEFNQVEKAFASDLMSDVLTLNTHSLLLITGLANLQTMRTAEMADIKNILLVRNKKPSAEMLLLAEQEMINIISTKKSMFNSCALLSKAGLSPVY